MNLQQVGRVVVCLALLMSAIATAGQPATNSQEMTEALRYRAGVRNAPGKHQLSADRLRQVLSSLREKTGWQTLDFDQEGFLVCPDPQVYEGGSASARQLLSAALTGTEVFELEEHNRSPMVSFARLTEGIACSSARSGAQILMYPVQLDFADFGQLRGHATAIQAFDPGIAILHELAHGVWKLRDAARAEQEPGECESFINRIRRELQLPERRRYQAQARTRPVSLTSASKLIAELQFVRTGETPNRTKRKRYWLQWEIEQVGGIVHFDFSKVESASGR